MRKPLTAVLGCGPSGLIAALACAQRGVPTVLISRKTKSVLGGAQYSHIKIPREFESWDDPPEAMLTYQVRGSGEGYQRKVYGDAAVPFVSIDSHKDGEQVPAWSLMKLYDGLWNDFESKITNIDLDPISVNKLLLGFDLVISSVPLPTICWSSADPGINHWFKQQTIRIWNENIEDIPDNTILYDGTDERSWYRTSKIFGVGSTEWSAFAAQPPLPGLRTVNKPLDTNCNCHEGPAFLKVGRFGIWQKGVLTYHAFNQVVEKLLLDWGIE